MRCPIIVGREAEQTSIDELVAGASQGRGDVVALVGEAGIGKTRLAEYATQRAETLGMTVMIGRASPRSVALRPIAELLLDGTRELAPPIDSPDAAPFLAVVGTLIPHWLPPGVTASAEHPLVLAEGVFRSIRHVAGDAGALVMIEDMHWADDETEEVVSFLASRLADTPVAMLLTARDDQETGPPIPDDVRQLNLEPLTAPEVEAMAEACVGAVGAEVTAKLVEQSEGIPLLVEDVLATSPDDHARFPTIVAARLSSLTDDARQAVEAAAVIGPDVDSSVVASTLDVSSTSAVDACEQALIAGLLRDTPDGLRFRHALTRDAILGALSSARTKALASAAAAAILDRPTTTTSLVDAAELLIVAGESDSAVRILTKASKTARAERRLGAAESALRRAVEVDDSDPSVLLDLAEVLLELGKVTDASTAARTALTRAEGRERSLEAAARLALARADALQGRWEPASQHVMAARRAGAGETRIRAEAAVLDARLALGSGRAGGRAEAAHLAGAAAARAREAGFVDLECEARLIGGLAARTTDLDASIAALEEALHIAENHDLERLRLETLNELGASELLRHASADRLERALIEAERAGAIGLSVSIRVNLAAVYLMTARFTEAVSVADQVESTATLLGLDPLVAVSHLHRGQVAALSGDRVTMDRHLSQAESLAPDDGDLLAAAWAVGRGLNAILDENHDAARRAFTRAQELGPDIHAAFLNPFEGPALLLRAIDGDVSVDEADAARRRIVKGARYHELWIRSAFAVALGSEHDVERAADELSAALDAGERYPIFSAIVGRLVAQAQRRDGWGDPVALLRLAEAEFHSRGLTRIAAACRGLLKESGAAAPRRRARDENLPEELVRAGVTVREAEVLDLLIDRLTNKQIAERLYCSPRTVEKHVASLTTKLEADRVRLAEIGRALRR